MYENLDMLLAVFNQILYVNFKIHVNKYILI